MVLSASEYFLIFRLSVALILMPICLISKQ